MKPHTPHYVVSLEPSIVWGRHFYASSTIRASVIGIVQTFVMGLAVTNALHDNTRTLLRRLMVMWSDFMRLGKSQPGTCYIFLTIRNK